MRAIAAIAVWMWRIILDCMPSLAANPGEIAPLLLDAERDQRSEFLYAEAGQDPAAFPLYAPLSPLAALVLRCAPVYCVLRVGTGRTQSFARGPALSVGVRVHLGISVRLRFLNIGDAWRRISRGIGSEAHLP